jgi:integrase
MIQRRIYRGPVRPLPGLLSRKSIPLEMREFIRDLQIAKRSDATIKARVELIERLRGFLAAMMPPIGLLDAATDDLRAFQATYAHLAPASVNIYSRHLRAFYEWAARRELVETNPAAALVVPRVPRSRPHPTKPDDLRVIFACTRGPLRLAYVLAAFAGLRRGEICRLHARDLDLSATTNTALVHGKGGHERVVPLLRPVVDELEAQGATRGWVVTRRGKPYDPEQLSIDSHHHLAGLGIGTTLHSMRAAFATHAARVTRDPLFVRDLLGHQSVRTTEIYLESTTHDAHNRLAGVTSFADDMLGGRGLRVVGG